MLGQNFLKGSKSSKKPPFSGSNGTGIELPITVSIPNTEAESSGYLGQKHIVFLVQVTAFGLSSVSRHSLEDFGALHAQISGKVAYKLTGPPQRYWWGNEDQHVVKDNKVRLESWLQQLLEQPEILSDGEELLMKFLNMPKASSAAVRFVLNTSQHWLERLYETTSESQGERVLKDAQLEAALLMVLEAQSSFESKRLACELLARRFRGGETESTSSSMRSCQVKVLLSLLNTEEPERMPVEVRTAARKALLTMAQDVRSTWSAVLLEVLNEQGLSQLLEASSRSGNEGQRLVVELFLRGFEDPVVQRFAQPDLAAERKQLLNELFLSGDAFVRVSMGILLAALLTSQEYSEANQAEAGLVALREEFFRGRPSVPADLRSLLIEDQSWHFLFQMARGHSGASNFALLVMLSLDEPRERIWKTPGLQDLLVEKLTDRQDAQLRGLAAHELLELQAHGEGDLVDGDLLGRAVASSAMEALEVQQAELQSITAGAEEASQRHRLVSQLEVTLSSGLQSTQAFRAQAEAWQSCLAEGAQEAAEASYAQGGAEEALTTLAGRLKAACAELQEDGTGGTSWSQEEILASCGPGDVARAQAELDELLEARRDLGMKLAEQQEAFQRVSRELEESKLCLAKDASAAIRVAESQAQRDALLQDLALGQEKADALDLQMREACEALSLYKASLEAKRASAKPNKGMQAWMAVREAQEASEGHLGAALSCLQRAGQSLKEETRCRARLRGTVRELVQSLVALDEELENLQQHDVALEESEVT